MNTIIESYYPYTEGNDYYTIEDSNIVWSTWDCNSEESHTDNSIYFDSINEAKIYATNNRIVIDNIYDYEKHIEQLNK